MSACFANRTSASESPTAYTMEFPLSENLNSLASNRQKLVSDNHPSDGSSKQDQ